MTNQTLCAVPWGQPDAEMPEAMRTKAPKSSTRDTLPELPPPYTISRQIIELWRNQR